MAREQFMVEIEYVLSGAAKAEFHVLGFWLRLSAHCAARLLGGRLKGAQAWSDGVCVRSVGLPRSALDEMVAGEVAWWDADDLVLARYDLEGERLWKRQSKGGKEGNKTRWGGRSPDTSPDGSPAAMTDEKTESETDAATESETDIGDRIRDSESVCESESEGDSEQRAARRAREGLSDSQDRRLLAACDHGAWMIDRKTGEQLHNAWVDLILDLDVPEIVAVFESAKRLTGHEVRYPSGFTKAHNALVAEKRAARARNEQVAAQAQRDERRVMERAAADRQRELSQHQVATVDAFLGSAVGLALAVAIAANPDHTKRLAAARRHAQTGGGANLSLHLLAKDYPDIKTLLQSIPSASQGSAP